VGVVPEGVPFFHGAYGLFGMDRRRVLSAETASPLLASGSSPMLACVTGVPVLRPHVVAPTVGPGGNRVWFVTNTTCPEMIAECRECRACAALNKHSIRGFR
jgi:hypothetical protein